MNDPEPHRILPHATTPRLEIYSRPPREQRAGETAYLLAAPVGAPSPTTIVIFMPPWPAPQKWSQIAR
jgi:hypothetical protein